MDIDWDWDTRYAALRTLVEQLRAEREDNIREGDPFALERASKLEDVIDALDAILTETP